MSWRSLLAFAAQFVSSFFFFNDTATTEIYTLSLHDALPICHLDVGQKAVSQQHIGHGKRGDHGVHAKDLDIAHAHRVDRKSTRLNSSHGYISYAVFCLKKKTNNTSPPSSPRSTRDRTSSTPR